MSCCRTVLDAHWSSETLVCRAAYSNLCVFDGGLSSHWAYYAVYMPPRDNETLLRWVPRESGNICVPARLGNRPCKACNSPLGEGRGNVVEQAMAPLNSSVPSQLLLQLLQFLSEEGCSDALHGCDDTLAALMAGLRGTALDRAPDDGPAAGWSGRLAYTSTQNGSRSSSSPGSGMRPKRTLLGSPALKTTAAPSRCISKSASKNTSKRWTGTPLTPCPVADLTPTSRSPTMSTGYPVTHQRCQQEGSHRRYQDLEEGPEDLPGAESGDFQ